MMNPLLSSKMFYAPDWYYLHVTLITALALLLCVSGVLCQETIDDFYCPVNSDGYASEQVKSLKNCKAAIQSRKLHVKCNVYATSALELPLFTTAGILLTDAMEAFRDIDDIVRQPSNSSCLKLISIRIRKLHSTDSEFLENYNQYTCVIPKQAFFPLMLIRQMDLLTVFDSGYAVGILRYNKTCLQVANNLTANQTSPTDVSNCIWSTDVVRKFLKSGNDLGFPSNITMEELFSKDFLSVSFVVMTNIFFEGYNYSILSAFFKTELFKYLPTDALTILSQKNVRDLGFQSNSISSIRNGDIPNIKSLRNLDLNDCKIELIEPYAFDGVIHLEKLSLRGNRLKELPEAFHILSNLKILNLQSNGDSDTNEFRYKDRVLVTQTDLRRLDLSNMILLNFWESLENFTKLEYLNLFNCTLHYIPSANITYLLPSLIYLNLSNNDLASVSVRTFSGLDKLTYLDLSKNNLAHVPYNDFIDVLRSLKLLSLNSNAIRDFLPLKPDESTLRSLDLSFNGILLWNTSRINSTYNFLEVNLMGNNITEVNAHMISDFNRVKHVKLARNPFDCESCTMKLFLAWIKLKNSSTDYSQSPYTCSFPRKHFKRLITYAGLMFEMCKDEVFDWILNVVVPFIVIICLGLLAFFLICYRWHLQYFIYLFQSKFQKYGHHHNASGFKYDAFVSYCCADRNWVVEYLIPAMEFQAPKLHLCVHERDFEIGETIMNNVIECIDSSHKSIFVLSERFVNSQWCQWELQMARHKLFEDKRDVLILIMLGELSKNKTPKILKRLISKRTYLQWSMNENCQRLFWKRLKDSIGRCQCLSENLSCLKGI